MKKLFGFLGARWFLTLVGTAALALLVWFVGPLFGFAGSEPLAEERARWLVIGGLFAVWALYQIGSAIAARLRNRRMVDQLAAAAPIPDATEVATAEELDALRTRFDEALGVLKATGARQRLGGRYLYQLPWYLIIGPPGCGKTTALVNSGLQFPLAERFGQDAIRGVGGTRNCDWWFTDQAVLLDTAGRYTTQDSYEAVDSAAWQGFLDLLKKNRPRRPINGVLVAVSLADLMEQTNTERALHARAIKQRVQELHQRLGIRFPVYVLFMKADLIAGFMEFFNDLGKDERAQVWGVTFPVDEGAGEASVIDALPGELDLLQDRLEEQMLERLQRERDPGKRSLIFAFPQQFGLLRDVIDRFLRDVFQPTRFEERALVRGVYFTSGTQTGAPIDRVLSALAANFRLDRQAMSAFAGSGRSYFIQRLLGDVVFPEAGLAGTNPRLERRRRWLQRGAYATAIGVALLAAGAWLTSYTRNQAYVEDVSARTADIETRIQQLPKGDRDPLDVLPLLDAARNIPGGYADRDRGAPMLMGLGLYQGDKLGPQASSAYRRLLIKSLLPRIILRLEDQIREASSNPDYLYEALRIYLMLDTPEHYNGQAVQTWIELDWDTRRRESITTEQRDRLKAHLAALFEERPTPLPIELDGDLVDQAREILSRRPLAEGIYSRLKEEGLGGNLSDFTISEAAGDYAGFVFERKSGKPLNQGIPALYTYDGYHSGFDKKTIALIAGTLEDSWILGPGSRIAADSAQAKELLDAVRDLYLRDYVEQWKGLLDDMEIIPFRSLEHAVEMLRVLSDKEYSPLRRLLEAASQQTTLDKDSGLQEAAVGKATEALGKFTERFGRFFQDTDLPVPTGPAEAPESYVTRRFEKLHAFVAESEDHPAPIVELLNNLNRLYFYIKAVSTAADSGNQALIAIKGESAELKEVRDAVDSLPLPVKDWVGTVTQDSGNLISGGARAQINKIWTAEVLPFCREAIHGRYPLQRGSARETTLFDFGRLFGTDGLIDSFFKENLSKIVDTSKASWDWLGGGVGIPKAALAQFQRAAVIREAFFAGGGQTPSASFEMKPLTMDADVTQFILDLEGQILDYRHGPPQASKLQWPGPEGPGRVRVVMVDSRGGRPSITEEGPWAWFRVLDKARTVPSKQPELFRVTFSAGGSSATFELRATSVRNPFHLDELRRFECPARL